MADGHKQDLQNFTTLGLQLEHRNGYQISLQSFRHNLSFSQNAESTTNTRPHQENTLLYTPSAALKAAAVVASLVPRAATVA